MQVTRSHMNDYKSLTTLTTTVRLPLPHEEGVRDVITIGSWECVGQPTVRVKVSSRGRTHTHAIEVVLGGGG